MTSTKPAVFWRDSLPIHPAAELFPLMPPDELRVLGEDIMKNGLRSPIVLWRADDKTPAVLLDGRNRLDAIEMAPGSPVEVRNVVVLDHTTDPYAFVISTNIHRRHLTAEKKRELIANLLKAQPDRSDRQIAATVKADHKTVGAVRTGLEARGEIPHVGNRQDSKGRKQPTAKKKSVNEPAAASPKKMTTKSLAQEDIGPNSADEIARLNARVDELQNQKRRLEIENVGLRNEIEKLTATNNSLRQQIAELIGAQAKFDNAAPAADDGGMPDIPAFLRKTAS